MSLKELAQAFIRDVEATEAMRKDRHRRAEEDEKMRRLEEEERWRREREEVQREIQRSIYQQAEEASRKKKRSKWATMGGTIS